MNYETKPILMMDSSLRIVDKTHELYTKERLFD